MQHSPQAFTLTCAACGLTPVKMVWAYYCGLLLLLTPPLANLTADLITQLTLQLATAIMSLPSPAHASINTLWPPPAGLHTQLPVTLVAIKVLLALDLLLALDKWLHHLALSTCHKADATEQSSAGPAPQLP